MLTGQGFVVVEAVDGLDGKRKLDADGDFCLVLCDVHMPRMNGIDMLEAIAAEARHTAIPVIMLTTEGRPSMMRRAGRAGAKGWLIKPFKARQLLAEAVRLVDGEASGCCEPDDAQAFAGSPRPADSAR